jgi:hypothetical protein
MTAKDAVSFLNLCRTVRAYVGVNAQNVRKGYRLKDISDTQLLDHAAEELDELREAPHDPDEMADTLACLVHYCIRRGWTAGLMEDLVRRKLLLRFGPLPGGVDVGPGSDYGVNVENGYEVARKGVNDAGVDPQAGRDDCGGQR